MNDFCLNLPSSLCMCICIKWNMAGEHEIFIRQALSKKFGLKSWNDKSEKLPVAMALA